MEADRKICIPVMHELVSLVKEYQRVLAAKKAEKNLAIAARSLDVIDALVAKGI